MADKLDKKLQVLLSEEMVTMINRIILNDALENEERPISVSAFIRDLIENEINRRPRTSKEWNKNKISKLKDK
jgi:hypothetical protein|tara:strand:- start:344 stop:562 length:219 start_codon:yes stop_codon:yes gene_type:complete